MPRSVDARRHQHDRGGDEPDGEAAEEHQRLAERRDVLADLEVEAAERARRDARVGAGRSATSTIIMPLPGETHPLSDAGRAPPLPDGERIPKHGRLRPMRRLVRGYGSDAESRAVRIGALIDSSHNPSPRSTRLRFAEQVSLSSPRPGEEAPSAAGAEPLEMTP